MLPEEGATLVREPGPQYAMWLVEPESKYQLWYKGPAQFSFANNSEGVGGGLRWSNDNLGAVELAF